MKHYSSVMAVAMMAVPMEYRQELQEGSFYTTQAVPPEALPC